MNRLKNLFLLIAVVITLSSLADNYVALLDSANNCYAKNNFETAINDYEKIISNGYEASEVYYNLGNAYYKSNKIAFAILNYERAAKLAPNDEDIKFNLKLADQKIVDRIDLVPQLFISEWKNNFINSLSEKGWSILLICFLAGGFTLLAIYLLAYKAVIKQLCFWAALLLFFSSIPTFFIANAKNKVSENKKEAIIISSSVNVSSSPTENGTKVFVLHEGTKVTITETNADWTEVRLANGNVGWVRTSDIVFI